MNDQGALHAPIAPRLGAAVVRTDPFELTQRFGEQVLAFAGILLLMGEPGTGKTFAATTFCRAADVPVLFLHLADTVRGHDVLRDLLEQLGLASGGGGRALLERAREALLGRRLVILVDEAHQLNREALRQLRYLFDQPGMRFALILTGSDFSKAFGLVPEFESRVARCVHFSPLKGRALIEVLREHHPIFAASDPAVLRAIDRQHCRGLWREWDHVLRDAAGYGATATDGITSDVAQAVLAGLKRRRA
jgi:DNA transposition AAA+ family ATPase